MNTYILQKDLPNLKAGAFFVWSKNENGIVQYFSFVGTEGDHITFLPEFVENNIEWFKLKEEPDKWSFNLLDAVSMCEGKCFVKNTRIEYKVALAAQLLMDNGYEITGGKFRFRKGYLKEHTKELTASEATKISNENKDRYFNEIISGIKKIAECGGYKSSHTKQFLEPYKKKLQSLGYNVTERDGMYLISWDYSKES